MSYTLPELGYAYDALEPHFDAQTMEIHHSKHHQAYVNNANAVLETLPAEFSEMCAGQLISQLDKIPVHYVPEFFDVVWTTVLEFQVVSVFPNV